MDPHGVCVTENNKRLYWIAMMEFANSYHISDMINTVNDNNDDYNFCKQHVISTTMLPTKITKFTVNTITCCL